MTKVTMVQSRPAFELQPTTFKPSRDFREGLSPISGWRNAGTCLPVLTPLPSGAEGVEDQCGRSACQIVPASGNVPGSLTPRLCAWSRTPRARLKITSQRFE